MRKVSRTCPRCEARRPARYNATWDRFLCPSCVEDVEAGAPLDLDRAAPDSDVTVTTGVTDGPVRYYGRSED